MGLILPLTSVVFTLFGVTLILKPLATLLDVIRCVRLHTLLHVVGCCSVRVQQLPTFLCSVIAEA